MAGRNVSVEDAIRTLRNIVAPPGQWRRSLMRKNIFKELGGYKKEKSNTKKPEKTKKPRTKKRSHS